jgi:hypothetical protein
VTDRWNNYFWIYLPIVLVFWLMSGLTIACVVYKYENTAEGITLKAVAGLLNILFLVLEVKTVIVQK